MADPPHPPPVIQAEAPPATPRLRGHLPVLDGIRGVAILMVMVHHLAILTPHTPLEAWFIRVAQLGAHGVDLFFVLSGFLITGILLDSRGSPGYFRRFYIRRALRIFPIYYAVLLIVFVVTPIFHGLRDPALGGLEILKLKAPQAPWYFAYASNFYFAIHKSFMIPELGPTWSLAVEEQFYLTWALVVAWLSPLRLRQACVVLIVAAAAWRIGLWQLASGWLVIWVSTFSHIDALAVGALIAGLLRPPGAAILRLRRAALPLLGLGLAVSLLLFLRGELRFDSGLFLRFGYPALVFGMGGLLLRLLFAPPESRLSRVFSSRTLGFFARYSYAMYLFHVPISKWTSENLLTETRLRALPGPALLGQGLYFLLAGGLVCGAAWLSWRLFEGPILSLKERWT